MVGFQTWSFYTESQFSPFFSQTTPVAKPSSGILSTLSFPFTYIGALCPWKKIDRSRWYQWFFPKLFYFGEHYAYRYILVYNLLPDQHDLCDIWCDSLIVERKTEEWKSWTCLRWQLDLSFKTVKVNVKV